MTDNPFASQWHPDARSMETGHRTVTYYGLEPTATRELPWQLWAFELAARGEARVRGWLIRTGRMKRS
jgi:hypothetical protein